MNASPIYERITRRLDILREQSLFRTIPLYYDRSNTIDLSTNSYLGLHDNSDVRELARKLAHHTFSGNLASRLVTQYSPLFDELESEIADWKGTETSLVFNSGYAANIGIIQALCKRDTEVFSDRLNHASIYDGIKLSGCRLTRYRHVDMHDLEKRLQASSARERVIITDTVFSMDGDRAPLHDIVELADKYTCLTMVDEAHATGIFGSQGSGLAEELGVAPKVDIVMGTMSKALAGYGGFAAVSTTFRDYFINTSRSLIYSTALPHAVLAHNLAAIKYIRSHPLEGKLLLDRSAHFRRLCRSKNFSCGHSTTQIIPLITGSERKALALKAYLNKQGIIAPAIRPPTVPAGSARVRCSIHNSLNRLEMDKIIDILGRWGDV